MEKKPGWNYSFIDSLKMHIAISEKSNVLYTEDKTMYTPEECFLLKAVDYQIPVEVHILKKQFDCLITSIEKIEKQEDADTSESNDDSIPVESEAAEEI